MPTFLELSTQLDSALSEVNQKKSDYNSANTLLIQTSSELQASVQRAQSIRAQLTSLLNTVLPEVDTHVSQSA